MKLLCFDIIATLVYALSMSYFVHEFRTVSPEERHERQTVLMLLTITFVYVAVVWKTHALAVMFAGG